MITVWDVSTDTNYIKSCNAGMPTAYHTHHLFHYETEKEMKKQMKGHKKYIISCPEEMLNHVLMSLARYNAVVSTPIELNENLVFIARIKAI